MPSFDDAIAHAQAHEIDWTRDPAAEPARWGIHQADPPPWNRLLGPVHARGGVSGVVRQHGVVRAAWGEPHRADLTFSVAKTYLAFLAGLAHAEGRLPDPDRPVAETLPGIGFDTPHNRTVTWSHLLSQTSEWEGSCFGVPDTVDRWRVVSFDPRPPAGVKGQARPLQAPGSYWEYNDVRINQLSLALQHLWRRPLPEVFDEAVRRPLGARDPFAWRGYDGVGIDLPGRPDRPNGAGGSQDPRGVDVRQGSGDVQSPVTRVPCTPGGSHWGGGVSISAHDQALIGELLLHDGRAGPSPSAAQIVPADWIRRMRQPQPLAPFYGWLVWLNTPGTDGRRPFPGTSEGSVFMVGAGGHFTWVEPAHDAVVVVRWLDPAHLIYFISKCMVAFR